MGEGGVIKVAGTYKSPPHRLLAGRGRQQPPPGLPRDPAEREAGHCHALEERTPSLDRGGHQSEAGPADVAGGD